jgi:hypothetical protein
LLLIKAATAALLLLWDSKKSRKKGEKKKNQIKNRGKTVIQFAALRLNKIRQKVHENSGTR